MTMDGTQETKAASVDLEKYRCLMKGCEQFLTILEQQRLTAAVRHSERTYNSGRLSVRREAGEHLFHRLLHADLIAGLSDQEATV